MRLEDQSAFLAGRWFLQSKGVFAQHGHVILAAPAHILNVRRLEKGVDPGEVRQFAA